MKLLKGDCLDLHTEITDGSVDLILTDLPYGTVKSIDNVKHGMSGKCTWDNVIDTEKIMNIANRILRKNGKMILFGQQPFTTELINKSSANVPHSYNMIWLKDHFANSLFAKKAPLNYYEDILVFSKLIEDKQGHTMQKYFYNEFLLCGYSIKQICEHLKTKHASHFFTKGQQFRVPNEKYLNELQILTGRFNITYKEIIDSQDTFLNENRLKYPSTFNLWQGNKYKSNILKYAKDRDGYHPTQKPILLLEDLIKTFSNEDDLVVDLTMGSGSTGVACVNTNRDFIGIEQDDKYYDIACKRIKQAGDQLTMI